MSDSSSDDTDADDDEGLTQNQKRASEWSLSGMYTTQLKSFKD